MPVRLAELDSAANRQDGEPFAAPLEAREVAIDVEPGWPEQALIKVLGPVVGDVGVDAVRPVREVGMLGERERWQSDLDCTGAGGLHRAGSGVPRPLRVDVVIGRKCLGVVERAAFVHALMMPYALDRLLSEPVTE